jgi:hypothetical protein
LQNNVLCHSERSEESYIAMYLLRFLPLVEMTKFLFCSFCKRLYWLNIVFALFTILPVAGFVYLGIKYDFLHDTFILS